MKKLSYIILGFIIGGVLTYYFCPRGPELDSMETELKTVDRPPSPPKDTISQKFAKKLNKNWSQYRCKAMDSCITAQTGGKKDKDNRWTEWSLDDIKEYLNYAEYKAEELGYKMTGLRVYLGVYGDQDEASEKSLTTTMFMVPRGVKSDGHKEASMMPFSFTDDDDNDLPMPPLNNGTGGNGGYPN